MKSRGESKHGGLKNGTSKQISGKTTESSSKGNF